MGGFSFLTMNGGSSRLRQVPGDRPFAKSMLEASAAPVFLSATGAPRDRRSVDNQLKLKVDRGADFLSGDGDVAVRVFARGEAAGAGVCGGG